MMSKESPSEVVTAEDLVESWARWGGTELVRINVAPLWLVECVSVGLGKVRAIGEAKNTPSHWPLQGDKLLYHLMMVRALSSPAWFTASWTGLLRRPMALSLSQPATPSEQEGFHDLPSTISQAGASTFSFSPAYTDRRSRLSGSFNYKRSWGLVFSTVYNSREYMSWRRQRLMNSTMEDCSLNYQSEKAIEIGKRLCVLIWMPKKRTLIPSRFYITIPFCSIVVCRELSLYPLSKKVRKNPNSLKSVMQYK